MYIIGQIYWRKFFIYMSYPNEMFLTVPFSEDLFPVSAQFRNVVILTNSTLQITHSKKANGITERDVKRMERSV